MIESILAIVKYAGVIYADKVSKEWPKEAAELETILMEEIRRDPDSRDINRRDMSRYDDAKRKLFVMNKQVSALMKQQAAKS